MTWKQKAVIGTAIVAGVGASIFGGYQIRENQIPTVRPAFESLERATDGTLSNFHLQTEGSVVKDGDYQQVDLGDHGYARKLTTDTTNSTIVIDSGLVEKLRLNDAKITTRGSVVFIGDGNLLESAGTLYSPQPGKKAIRPKNE